MIYLFIIIFILILILVYLIPRYRCLKDYFDKSFSLSDDYNDYDDCEEYDMYYMAEKSISEFNRALYNHEVSKNYVSELYEAVKKYESTNLTPEKIKNMIKDFEEILDCNDNPDNGKYCAFYSVTGCRLKAACGACIPKWHGSLSEEQIKAEIERYRKEL